MTTGERWAADELDALRASRFTGRAWGSFLRASFRRAAETRSARPRLARQAHTWSAAGFVGGAAACIWGPRSGVSTPRACRFALWWLAVSAMLDWHLGMVEGPGGEARVGLASADAVTLLRLWSVPFVSANADRARRCGPVFSGLIVSAALTDALDGALARRAGTTRLGRDLDKSADALTIAAASRAAARAGWLPAGVAHLAIARSGLPVAVVAATYFRTGSRPRVDSLPAGRQLTPLLVGGLATAPFWPSLGAALVSTASIASLASGWVAARGVAAG